MENLIWPFARVGHLRNLTIEDRDCAFEMKGQILRLASNERRNNPWVLQNASTDRELYETVKRRKISCFGFGHITRTRRGMLAWTRISFKEQHLDPGKSRPTGPGQRGWIG